MKKYRPDLTVRFFVTVMGLFAVCFILKELQHILIPFVVAYFLFFFFEPLNEFLKSKKIPLTVVVFIDLLLIVSLLYGISKIVIDSFASFGAQLPEYEQKLNHIISSTAVSFGLKNRLITHFDISKIIQSMDIGVLASGVFSSTLSVMVSVFLTLFFFIFINTGHNKIFEAIRIRFVEKEVKSQLKLMKKEGRESEETVSQLKGEDDLEQLTLQREIKLRKTIKDITEKVQKYVVTKFLISLLMGLVFGIVLKIFDVHFFVIWAILAILLNFIPNIGSVFAIIMPVLMVLVQFESFGYALLLAAVLIVLQNIIGNIIEPKVFGDRLGLNPLVILLSLLLWGYLWGIVGMFLSVPLTAVGKIILSNFSSKNMRFITNLMSN